MPMAWTCPCCLYKTTSFLGEEHKDSAHSPVKVTDSLRGGWRILQCSPKGSSQILGVSMHACKSHPARSNAPQSAEISGKDMVGQEERQQQFQGHGWEGQCRQWGVGMEDREGGLAAGPGTDYLFGFCIACDSQTFSEPPSSGPKAGHTTVR